MSSTVITKNSSTASAVPTAGQLEQGELAVNVTDKKVYTKDSGGTVVKLVGSLGNQEANAVAITGGTITGLGTPSGASDAATKNYVDTILGSTETAAASAAAAASSASAAATSAANALTSETNAAASAAAAAASAASIADGPVVSVNGLTGIVTGIATQAGTETLTNKTIEAGTLTNGYTEEVFALGTTGSIALSPANGSIQTCALTGDPTFTDSLAAGQSIVLMLTNGSTYTVTWPTVTWVKAGGSAAPTLTANDVLVFWKVSTTLYGAYVGSGV